MSDTLEVQNREPMQVSDFSQVEDWLQRLRAPSKHSFAMLSRQNGGYAQIAGGRVTCVVEVKESPDSPQLRAELKAPRTALKGRNSMAFGGGTISFLPEECLFVEDAIEVFRSFYCKSDYPKHISFSELSGEFL